MKNKDFLYTRTKCRQVHPVLPERIEKIFNNVVLRNHRRDNLPSFSITPSDLPGSHYFTLEK